MGACYVNLGEVIRLDYSAYPHIMRWLDEMKAFPLGQLDFDLHIALEVDMPFTPCSPKGKERGIETRGITDHGMVHSIYFRDPNGYVVELTAKTAAHDDLMNPATNRAREILDIWQAAKG